MAIILEGLQNVANYLYYIIVLRRTLQEHDQVLKNVQQRLKDAGLLLNESKCQFKKQSLKFLGLIVTAQGDCSLIRNISPQYSMHLHHRTLFSCIHYWDSFHGIIN